MKNNIFELTTGELQYIANSLQAKIEEGLKKDGMEISDIPTHINPKDNIEDGKVLALDWGGTNFRAAIVEFKNGKPSIIEGPKKRLLDKETTASFKRDDLLREMAATISELKSLDSEVSRIGYCFSYPARCEINGDATLMRWTKGINISVKSNPPSIFSFRITYDALLIGSFPYAIPTALSV